MISKLVEAKPSRTRTFRGGRLSEQVVDEIEKLIKEEFPGPGRRLPKEEELAERFGVSRIVIREAMKILEDRGLVEVRAGRGSCTVSPSPDKVKQSLLRLFIDQPIPSLEEMERMLELRGILEETVASLAAVRARPEDLDEMDAALNEMARAKSEDEANHADLRFHAALAKSAHNRYFEMVMDPLAEAFVQQMKLTNPHNLGVEMHRSILDAVRKRNQVAARQAARRLLKQTLHDLRHGLVMLGEQAGGAKE